MNELKAKYAADDSTMTAQELVMGGDGGRGGGPEGTEKVALHHLAGGFVILTGGFVISTLSLTLEALLLGKDRTPKKIFIRP